MQYKAGAGDGLIRAHLHSMPNDGLNILQASIYLI